jgi:hypothetical protein
MPGMLCNHTGNPLERIKNKINVREKPEIKCKK